MPKKPSYYDVLTQAINDLAENGYDSAERVAYWSEKIKEAADRTLGSESEMERQLRDALIAVYNRILKSGEIATFRPGVARFSVERIRPQLRAELDRRIMAAAGLIRLNRKEAVEKTLRRFQGWATSIPKGGAAEPEKRKTKESVRKSLAGLPFEERRLLTDQGAKLRSSISEIVASDGGAIAGRWKSRWKQANYNYREEHKERDRLVYLVRSSWAHVRGLVKPGEPGYVDDVTRPAEEPFCQCSYVWIYSLGEMPGDMLTKRGREALDAARRKMKEMA